MSRRDASIALGITSPKVIARLGSQGELAAETVNPKMRGKVVSRAEVNKILLACWRADFECGKPVSALTYPLDQTIRSILNGQAQGAGYSLSHGLTSLRLRSDEIADLEPECIYLCLKETAARLKVHSDIVRSASRLGYLVAVQGRKGTSPLQFAEDAVENFMRRYAFGSVLAKSLGVDPLKFSSRLIAEGINPVGGPRIDGLLTYLFERRQLKGVDLRQVASKAFLDFNRRGKYKEADAEPTLTIKKIAEELGVRFRDVAKLVRMGLLKRVAAPGVQVQVGMRSYLFYRSRLRNSDLVPIEEVAVKGGDTLHEFTSKYVQTGLIKVIDLGLKRCVSKRDCSKLDELKEHFVTAAEVARETGKGRWTAGNLAAQGKIKAVHHGTGRKLKLYPRRGLREAIAKEQSTFRSGYLREISKAASSSPGDGSVAHGVHSTGQKESAVRSRKRHPFWEGAEIPKIKRT
jgi:hypothetical protein